jgi:hypothetical protein
VSLRPTIPAGHCPREAPCDTVPTRPPQPRPVIPRAGPCCAGTAVAVRASQRFAAMLRSDGWSGAGPRGSGTPDRRHAQPRTCGEGHSETGSRTCRTTHVRRLDRGAEWGLGPGRAVGRWAHRRTDERGPTSERECREPGNDGMHNRARAEKDAPKPARGRAEPRTCGVWPGVRGRGRTRERGWRGERERTGQRVCRGPGGWERQVLPTSAAERRARTWSARLGQRRRGQRLGQGTPGSAARTGDVGIRRGRPAPWRSPRCPRRAR